MTDLQREEKWNGFHVLSENFAEGNQSVTEWLLLMHWNRRLDTAFLDQFIENDLDVSYVVSTARWGQSDAASPHFGAMRKKVQTTFIIQLNSFAGMHIQKLFEYLLFTC